jgi:CubicO group peptidase (beta-lactamase class C family)
MAATTSTSAPSRSVSTLLTALAVSLVTGPLAAGELTAGHTGIDLQESPSAASPDPVTRQDARRRGPTDPEELEAFLDGVMRAQMEAEDIAGATVAVVRNGEILLARGYGWADVEERRPVDPERTLFRIGSVTKLVTWTAVMQLVEAGELDLHADVNRYLDFRIPDTFDEPITLWHILTHTPGFEEDSRDLFTEDPDQMEPLGEWLATHVPARVRPPGTFSSYSNYATALAGYIVERVSGEPYDAYVERHIFEPLDMRLSTTRQPLPDELAPRMSEGYAFENGRFEAKPFEIIKGAAPAGSMSAPATDMARFMLAHLNGGELDGQRILSEETVRTMQERAFTHDERQSGFALGFYEKSRPGLRIIGHGGDTRWFHTDLALVPSEDLGVFVSYNTASGGELSFGPFLDAFLEHYYPADPEPVTPSEEAREAAERVAGEYAFNRRSYTTFQKAFGLAQSTRVQAREDGSVVLHSPLGATRFVPLEPLHYREALGHQRLTFREDDDGRVTHGFLSLAPMMALERVPWHESSRLHQVLLGLAVLVFAGTVVAAVRRWWRRRQGITLPGDDLPGRRFLVAMAGANLAFVAALAVLLQDPASIMTGPLTGLKVALALPLLGLLLAVGALYHGVQQWRRRAGTLGARLRYGAVVALALLFAWSLSVWNLLGWQM